MAMIRLSQDFKEFLKLLKENSVRYLIVGGYAVGYHGYPRATAGLDIWVAMTPENAQKIVSVLREYGFDFPELTTDLFLKEEQIIRMGVPPVRLEITTSISGVDFDECFAERIVDKLDGTEVNLISLKHLKANKKAAGRHKDLNDLENLP
jgi:predicted nucleotidyltransferase